MSRPYEEDRRDALAALDQGDPRAAFSRFRWVLEYPGKLAGDDDWRDALDVFARIAEAIAGEELAGHVRAAAGGLDDPGPLFDLGYQLIEQQLHGIAATVLARAVSLDPGSPQLLAELVCALEGSGRNDEACRYLRAAPDLVEGNFICRYLLAYNALMSADLDEPRRLLPGLDALLAQEPSEQFPFMRDAIVDMLARADALSGVSPLDARDLRAWFFVVSGGLLLHISPHGFDEGMNGRYAFTQDSPARCLEGIQRLEAVLGAWGRAYPRVFVLPDRDSAILAHAAAQRLRFPAVPWPEGGSEEPGLIVAYDLAELPVEVLRTLRPHRPGQLLFAQASCWTDEPPFAADVTTYLYQINKPPFGERLGVDHETGKATQLPPEEGTVEKLAQRIVAATPDPEDLADLPALRAFAGAIARLEGRAAGGAFLGAGHRRRQRTDSPVKSSRFL